MPLLRMKAEGFIEDSMPAMASTLLTAQCVVVWSHPWKKYISVDSLLAGEPKVSAVGRTRSENLMAGFRPADAAALARDHYAAN